MTSRSSCLKNSSTTGFILKKSAAAPKPIMEVAAAPTVAAPATQLLPRSQSALLTQRNYSFSAAAGCQSQNHDYCSGHNSLQRQQSSAAAAFDQKKPQVQPVAQQVQQPKPTKVSTATNTNPEVIFPDQKGVGVVGQVIITSSHHAEPQHRLMQVNRPNPFTCMGCKEFGAGICFSCQQCNFELHHFCALAPCVLKSHPLHSQHHLVFYPKPTAKGMLRSRCDICGKAAKGYVYQCSACSFQLHPCCALLSPKMKFPTHPQHALILMPSNLNLQAGASGDALCAVCRRKRSGQVYRCPVCDYYLHAVCAKNMVNGLHALGIKGLDKPSMLGTAGKIFTHVVVGFVEGIFEGIGEGLGEALSQNFAKGKSCESTPASASASNSASASARSTTTTSSSHQSPMLCSHNLNHNGH